MNIGLGESIRTRVAGGQRKRRRERERERVTDRHTDYTDRKKDVKHTETYG